MPATLAALGALALSSCFPFLDPGPIDGEIAISLEDKAMVVAICRDMVVNEMLISERRNLPDSSYIRIWNARDLDLDFRSGNTLGLEDTSIADRVSAFRNPALKSGDRLIVFVNTTPASGDVAEQEAAEFEIPRDGLSDQLWLHPDGTQTDEPCSPKD